MKKWITAMILTAMLAGCGTEQPPDLETMGTVPGQEPARPTAGQIGVWMPQEATAEAMAQEDGGQIYTWGDYELRLQTMDSGDIHTTLERLSGLSYETLTVMAREKGDMDLYQTVWCAEGEDGTMLSRAIVADDGFYHYCVSLTAPEDVDASEIYERICATMAITDPDAKK